MGSIVEKSGDATKKHDPAADTIDKVDETSEESFPASDPPSWIVNTGEKGAEESAPEGCVTSFIMEKRGEIGGPCADVRPDPKEEFVQPDREKEAGGQGGS